MFCLAAVCTTYALAAQIAVLRMLAEDSATHPRRNNEPTIYIKIETIAEHCHIDLKRVCSVRRSLALIVQARDIVDDLCVNGVPARVLNGRFVISEHTHIAHAEVKCVYTAKVRAPMRSLISLVRCIGYCTPYMWRARVRV
jgi:hypothetical protein